MEMERKISVSPSGLAVFSSLPQAGFQQQHTQPLHSLDGDDKRPRPLPVGLVSGCAYCLASMSMVRGHRAHRRRRRRAHPLPVGRATLPPVALHLLALLCSVPRRCC